MRFTLRDNLIGLQSDHKQFDMQQCCENLNMDGVDRTLHVNSRYLVTMVTCIVLFGVHMLVRVAALS
jgi:hypothetical protein